MKEELFDVFHYRLVYFPEQQDTTIQLPISTLKIIAEKALGNNEKINALNIYAEKNSTIEFEVFTNDEKKESASMWGNAGIYWKRVHINPYNGNVNGITDLRYELFITVRAIHQHVYLNDNIGSPIVGTATIIFIILLVPGLFLWCPKNKAAAKQRFSFRWKATTKWKRKNYDLHNILSFYMFILGLFIALTDIVWLFNWWEKNSIPYA